MKRLLTCLSLIGALTFVLPTSAHAALIIVFDNVDPTTGTVAYNGTGGALTGTDIQFFDIITVSDGFTTINLDCPDCELDFTTGANTFESAALAVWGPGGSFTINGTITDPGNGDAVVATGLLLSGSFSGGAPAVAAQNNGQVTITGAGTDTKNADLLSYLASEYGFVIPDDFIYASTNITADNCTNNLAGGFSCVAQEGDVTNTGTAVPEPGALALFGVGLLAAGASARRRLRARK